MQEDAQSSSSLPKTDQQIGRNQYVREKVTGCGEGMQEGGEKVYQRLCQRAYERVCQIVLERVCQWINRTSEFFVEHREASR